MALTENALLSVAGEPSYARGESYVRYVRGLRVAATSAQASVQAKRVYVVTAVSGDDAVAKHEFVSMVRNALGYHGFVDYRDSFVVAESASWALDELETHLDGGSAEVVRPALLQALTLLRSITEQADDSSGSISGQCERAADTQLGQRARSGCGVHAGQAVAPTMSPPLN